MNWNWSDLVGFLCLPVFLLLPYAVIRQRSQRHPLQQLLSPLVRPTESILYSVYLFYLPIYPLTYLSFSKNVAVNERTLSLHQWDVFAQLCTGAMLISLIVLVPYTLRFNAGDRLVKLGQIVCVSTPMLFASLYLSVGINGDCLHGIVEGFDEVYFSYVAFTTVGFGDMQPTGVCRLIAATEAIVGYILLGLFVGASFSFFHSNDKR